MTARKRVIALLDREFSKYIRGRDKKCVICGTTKDLTCGHLFSRVAHSTRWDELNCHAQCRGCNLLHEYQPDIFTRWFIRKHGLERYEILASRFHKTRKYSLLELQALTKDYQKRNG